MTRYNMDMEPKNIKTKIMISEDGGKTWRDLREGEDVVIDTPIVSIANITITDYDRNKTNADLMADQIITNLRRKGLGEQN